jgi:sorting nexin-29
MLFNNALEKAVRASGIEKRGTIYYKSVQIVAYADDIHITGRTETAVREVFENLEITAREMGLQVNEGKTTYMEVTSRPTNQKVLKVKNYEFESVNEFKYLGTLVTNNNQITAEINHRIGIANHCYHGMKDMLSPDT